MKKLIKLHSNIEGIKEFTEIERFGKIHLIYHYKDDKTLVIKDIWLQLFKDIIVHVISITKGIRITNIGYDWIEVTEK